LLIKVARALFEVGDEPRQLAGLTGGFGENVNVIGHHAVGVQNEAEAGGTAGEQLDRHKPTEPFVNSEWRRWQQMVRK